MAKHEYRLVVDYEDPTEWGVGCQPNLPKGEDASMEEIATVLETVAALLRANFDNEPDENGELGPAVRYPGRRSR